MEDLKFILKTISNAEDHRLVIEYQRYFKNTITLSDSFEECYEHFISDRPNMHGKYQLYQISQGYGNVETRLQLLTKHVMNCCPITTCAETLIRKDLILAASPDVQHNISVELYYYWYGSHIKDKCLTEHCCYDPEEWKKAQHRILSLEELVEYIELVQQLNTTHHPLPSLDEFIVNFTNQVILM